MCAFLIRICSYQCTHLQLRLPQLKTASCQFLRACNPTIFRLLSTSTSNHFPSTPLDSNITYHKYQQDNILSSPTLTIITTTRTMSVSPPSTSTSTGTTTPTLHHCHAATQFQIVVQGYKDGNLTKEECISACNAFLSHEEHHRWCKAEAYLLLSHCSDNLFGSIAHAEKAARIFNKVFVGRGVRATEAKEQLRVTASRILDLKVEAVSLVRS